MQKSLFLKNTLILTLTALILRGVGIIFRVYLSNVIGSDGMGIYQLIFSLYTLMGVLSSAGFTVTSAKLVSENERKTIPAMRTCFYLSFLMSVFISAVFFVFSSFFSKLAIGYTEASECVKLLSFGLLFISLSACLKGYFTAIRKVSINSLSMIFEQTVRMSICFYALSKAPKGDIFLCCRGVVIANVISEVFAFLYLYVKYLKSPKPITKEKVTKRSFFNIFIPHTLSSYLNTFFHTLESFLVPNALFCFTQNRTLALSQFGALKAMTIPVIFFPASFLSAISTLLLPEISSMNENNNYGSIKKTLSFTVYLTLYCSFFIAGFFFLCADELSYLLYKDELVGHFIRTLSLVIPFMYLESIISGTLSALDLQTKTLTYNAVNSVLRIILVLYVVPHYGISAFLTIMLLSNIFTSTLCFINLYKKTHFPIDAKSFFIKPVFSVVASVLLGFFICPSSNSLLCLVIKTVVFSSAFLLFTILFKGFKAK